MLNENNLIDMLVSNNRKLEHKIKNIKIYTKYKILIDLFVNTGVILEKSLPFFLSFVVVSSIYGTIKNLPFAREELPEKAVVETVYMKDNFKREYVSVKNSSKDTGIRVEYTTGWKYNNNVYERNIVTFKIDNKLKLDDYKYILSLEYDDIISHIEIENIETINKTYLLPEDNLYFEDTPIIREIKVDDNREMYVKESSIENIGMSILYILGIIWGGEINIFLIKYLYKGKTFDKLKHEIELNRGYTLDQIDELCMYKELLQDNIKIIEEEDCLKNKYTKSLRKK